jgi:tRNA/rRNA methyltransferase
VRSAPAGEVERITALLMDALRASGYVKPRVAVSTEEKVRRLVRRLRIGPGDGELLLGMLRQVVWKVRSDVTE